MVSKTKLKEEILVKLQSLWRDNLYTRYNATKEINIILDKYSVFAKINILSLGGVEGFEVKILKIEYK